eukprot:IDg7851t1
MKLIHLRKEQAIPQTNKLVDERGIGSPLNETPVTLRRLSTEYSGRGHSTRAARGVKSGVSSSRTWRRLADLYRKRAPTDDLTILPHVLQAKRAKGQISARTDIIDLDEMTDFAEPVRGVQLDAARRKPEFVEMAATPITCSPPSEVGRAPSQSPPAATPIASSPSTE